MNNANAFLNSTRRLAGLMRYVRLEPFDFSTPEGRASERQRRVALTFLASLVAQGAKILTIIISVPLAIAYLGTERYGLWLTISSFAAFLSFTDLGIGNGLLNAISSASGRDDRVAMRRAISSSLFLLAGVSAGLLVAFWTLYPYIPWQEVFNVSSAQAVAESGPALAVFVVCFLVNIPFETVHRVQEGLQEGFRSKIWQAGGNLASLIAVITVINLQMGLPWLVISFIGVPIIATLCNNISLYRSRYPWLRPSWEFATKADAKHIANVGIMFLLLQLSMAVAFASDNMIIAQILGPAAVTQFGVPQRLFGLLLMLISIALSPLWPAYGEALSRTDTRWVEIMLTRTLRASLVIVGPMAFVLVLIGQWIIRIWVGPSIDPSWLLLSGFGVWVVISSLGNAMAMFLNGAGKVRFQVMTATAMAVANLVVSIYLTHRIGVSGPIWGSVIAYTIILLVPTFFYVRHVLKRYESTEH